MFANLIFTVVVSLVKSLNVSPSIIPITLPVSIVGLTLLFRVNEHSKMISNNEDSQSLDISYIIWFNII